MYSEIDYTYNYAPYSAPAAFEPTARQRAILIFFLITSVIIVTISFEMIKEFSISSANIYTKPVIETVFAEMTVLGFISVVGYALKYGGALDDISVYCFGEVGNDYVETVLEDAHYFLFLVMVLTVFQIYLMITITHSYMDKFDLYNGWCQNKSDMLNYLAEIDDVPPQTVFEWLHDYVSDPLGAWGKHARRQEVEELVVFFILREEHILKRSSLPPYLPAPKKMRLPVNFDYADYVSINLARLLQEAVRFTPLMWLGVWGFAVVALLLMLIFDGVYLAMGFMLVGFIYADAAAMFALRKNCAKIFDYFVNAQQVRAMEVALAETLADSWTNDVSVDLVEKSSTTISQKSYSSSQKVKPPPPEPLTKYSPMFIRTKLLLSKGAVPKQPVQLQPSKQTMQQSLLSRMAGGNVPNAQQQLFFGDSVGKTLNIYIFRLHLVLQSFYYSVMACFFIPYAYASYNVYISTALCVAALVPLPILYVSLYGRLLVYLTHLASTGCYTNVNVEKQVLLRQKTKKIFNLLLMLTKIHAAKISLSHRTHLNEKLSREVDHAAAVFDKYDKDEDGQIDMSQLRPLLQSLGMAIDEMQLHHMFELMNDDNKGLVSKDEFLAWFAAHRMDTRANIEELAHELFHSMEESSIAVDRRVLSNSSTLAKGGEMTKKEFIVAFKKFNDAPYKAGLSDDEIEDMADEFDETGDGIITWKDFFHVVKTGLEKRK